MDKLEIMNLNQINICRPRKVSTILFFNFIY